MASRQRGRDRAANRVHRQRHLCLAHHVRDLGERPHPWPGFRDRGWKASGGELLDAPSEGLLAWRPNHLPLVCQHCARESLLLWASAPRAWPLEVWQPRDVGLLAPLAQQERGLSLPLGVPLQLPGHAHPPLVHLAAHRLRRDWARTPRPQFAELHRPSSGSALVRAPQVCGHKHLHGSGARHRDSLGVGGALEPRKLYLPLVEHLHDCLLHASRALVLSERRHSWVGARHSSGPPGRA